MLPLSLLRTAQGHPMLVELKNGETYNGHLVNCDTWMNIHLREVICTSKVTDKVQEEKRIDRKPPITGRGRGIVRGDELGGRGPSKGGGQGYQEDGVSRGGGRGKGTGRGVIGKRGWPWPYVRAAYFIAEWKQFLTNHFTRFSSIWKVHRIYWPSGFVETW